MIDRRNPYPSKAWNWQHPNWPNFTWKSPLLAKAAIEAMQHESLAEHGGLAGIRDQGVLESALARCKNKSAYDSQRGRCCGDVYRSGSGRSDEGESCQVVRGAFESETIESSSTSASRSMLHVSLSIYVSPMPSLDHGDEEHIIQDFINDAVVANADSIEVVRTRELFATGWAWRVRQAMDSRNYSCTVVLGCEPGKFLVRRRLDENPIADHVASLPSLRTRRRWTARDGAFVRLPDRPHLRRRTCGARR